MTECTAKTSVCKK